MIMAVAFSFQNDASSRASTISIEKISRSF